VIVVVSGPIASGKSTVARALAQEVERRRATAAAIDLDIVYEMLEHSSRRKDDGSKWQRAERGAAALADAFLADSVDVVIVDGDFLRGPDRRVFVAALRTNVEPRFVTLRVSLEEALRRVADDPTRGLSRDPAFLRAYYDAAAALGDSPATDLVVDSESVTASEAAQTIADWVGIPRLPRV
jgi:chloramphenicol 3-O-phosphotransferase